MKRRILAVILSMCVVSGSAAFAAPPKPTASAEPEDSVTASAEPIESGEPEDGVTASAEPIESGEPEETLEPSKAPKESESPAPTKNPDAKTAASLDFDISVIKHDYVIDNTMRLELYNADDELLCEYSHWIGGVTESMQAHFDVPEYELGAQFRLKTAGGVNYMKYGSKLAGIGNSIVYTTGYHTDENGEFVPETSFAIECEPCHEKNINMYISGKLQKFSPRARMIDSSAMVPVRQAAEAIGMNVRYNEQYNCVICSAGKDEVIFNVGTNWNTILGKETISDTKSCNIGGTVYVPVRVLADAISSPITVKDYGERLDIALGDSELVENYRINSAPVNARGIRSDTSYLVWVSKHEFKVRVYTGSQYKWKLEKEFPCAIGAPGSETITGTFKYQYRMPSWDYGTYYVGPCLVFYGNYALHSTLQYYGGGAYDDRVGVKISHGCVRLHKNDINWIDSYVPRGSTIYVTE